LKQIEDKIWVMEGEYCNSSSTIGNIFKGWDMEKQTQRGSAAYMNPGQVGKNMGAHHGRQGGRRRDPGNTRDAYGIGPVVLNPDAKPISASSFTAPKCDPADIRSSSSNPNRDLQPSFLYTKPELSTGKVPL